MSLLSRAKSKRFRRSSTRILFSQYVQQRGTLDSVLHRSEPRLTLTPSLLGMDMVDTGYRQAGDNRHLYGENLREDYGAF